MFQGTWMDAALNFYRGGGSGAEFLHAENLRCAAGAELSHPVLRGLSH